MTSYPLIDEFLNYALSSEQAGLSGLQDFVETLESAAPEIKREAVKNGMRTLRQSALRKLAEGVTTFEEVVRVTGL